MRAFLARRSPAEANELLGAFAPELVKLVPELVDLILAVIAINGWTRLAISFRPVPGAYQPHKIDAMLEHA